MLEPRTMRSLAAMRPLRVICECSIERVISVADKHLGMTVEAYARAMRCSRCGLRGSKTFIGTITQPLHHHSTASNVVALFNDPDAVKHRKPKEPMWVRGVVEGARLRREAWEKEHGKPFELSEEDRQRSQMIRELIGWTND